MRLLSVLCIPTKSSDSRLLVAGRVLIFGLYRVDDFVIKLMLSSASIKALEKS